MERIEAVVVAVPARDEAARIRRCLIAVTAATEVWRGQTVVLVGADSCRDDTAAIAAGAGFEQVTVVEGTWRRPGAVRRALVDIGRGLVDAAPDRVWVASTDADCVVPPHWIAEQVALADAGADVVLGEVTLDPDDTPIGVLGAFDDRYRALGDRRRHVHAANLGIRLSAYDRAGGWRASTAIGEEHHLVRAAVDRGAAMHAGDGPVVVTSGRTIGRVRGGFATALRRLDPTGV